ncbi:MAG: hypothetical protein HFE79_13140 [Ruminiclostridium sp.]|nr:hypothetical protein [Ruminiclostridium sp.]
MPSRPRLTTYLTIDSTGVHGNNGYKTVEEDFLWSGNGYKKPFAAERTISALFGTQRSRVQITSSRPTNCYQKDIMPTNGSAKPFVGINLAKNRIRDPQIFSTRKWT